LALVSAASLSASSGSATKLSSSSGMIVSVV
jgi:hypothetical protein